MKKITISFLVVSLILGSFTAKAQVPVKPAHVIFVLEENYAYSDIIGSSYAPTLTALSKTSYTANFTQAFAITHPSEPNYLELFSGSNQGVTSDISGPAPNAPFNNCNLGSSLIQGGYTFIGYSEDQPSVGWINTDAPPYYTKHCPWINWIGTGEPSPYDSIPITSDIPFSYNATAGYTSGPIFPDSLHYSTLPTVAWVIPNIYNDMHDPLTPSTAIPTGDTWFKNNMMPLIRWATDPANNAVVITVWDEDDGIHSNNIPLLVSSGIVKGGNYSQKVNLYDILKTVEDMYSLPECGASATAKGGVDLTDSMWVVTGINAISNTTNQVKVWPVPATNTLNLSVTSANEDKAVIGLYDVTGRLVKSINYELIPGDNNLEMSTTDISGGVYFLHILGTKTDISKKVIIQ